MRYLCFLVFILCASMSSAQSGQFCFASAETYYEQVYCQLQAKAQAKGLPAFHQFRKNTEAVQFSLLKRPAARNAIKLPAPAKKTEVIPQQTTVSPPLVISSETAITKTRTLNETAAINETAALNEPALARVGKQSGIVKVESDGVCQLQGKDLQCGAQRFSLLGNKANHRLVKHALLPDNKMDLPIYEGGDLHKYLTSAYQRYIVKMCEIGLGSVTMTYGKFAYLYQDISSKGLDFTQRFETMYGFLKKDKTSMGVSESVTVPPGLVASECSLLGDTYYVCEQQGRNYIFVRQ